MADSVRETALKALHALLTGIAWLGTNDPVVKRNEPETDDIPAGGKINLFDGDAGEPVDVFLSPVAYLYQHRAEISVHVQHKDHASRDALMDSLLQQIGAALGADPTLGGTVDMASPATPETTDEPKEGAASIKAARVPVILEYLTSSPLG